MSSTHTLLKSVKQVTAKTLHFLTIAVFFLSISLSSNAQKKKSSGNNIARIYTYYLDIKNALVYNDGVHAKMAANEIHKLVTSQPDKGLNYRQMKVLGDYLGNLIDDSREIGMTSREQEQRVYLSDLSKSIYGLMKGLRMNTTKIYMQYCAKNNGYWLSETPVIKNPYYSYQASSSCGKTTEVLGASGY